MPLTRVLERVGDHRRVVHQVGVGEHHALGRAGRAGRVLQERQRVAVDVGLAPLASSPFSIRSVASQGIALRCGELRAADLHALEHFAGCQRDFRLGVVGDRFDSLHRAVAPRRIGGHSHHACVQAAEERGDKIESGRIQEQCTLAAKAHGLETCGDGASLPIELAIGDVDFLLLAVDEVNKRAVVPKVGRPMSK